MNIIHFNGPSNEDVFLRSDAILGLSRDTKNIVRVLIPGGAIPTSHSLPTLLSSLSWNSYFEIK